ncbi:hypothetical protein [Polaromonas sp. A23]|uniref:hypothetical protein n=1 Tax=Polaromonas sp. A23 TaxID=1944133 RepID=UPI0009863A92|nr:hypothetical protein B0B52_07450 [Polaromonas sp. A23]
MQAQVLCGIHVVVQIISQYALIAAALANCFPGQHALYQCHPRNYAVLCDGLLLADDDLVVERGEFIARGQGKDMQANGVRQLVAI